MNIPINIKEKLMAAKINELRNWSNEAGTSDILEELLLDKGYQHVSILLNEEDAFYEYWELVSLAKSLENNQLVVDLTTDFHHFLMAKICFPKEMKNLRFTS